MIRLLWVVLFTILLFLKSMATVMDYAFNAIILSAVFSECFNALKSLNYGYLKNDYKVHKKYLISKFIFLFANLIKLASLARLNCSLSQPVDENCLKNQLDAQFCVDLIWSLFEIYLSLVVYSFCARVNRGFYGPIGGTPIFPDLSLIDTGLYKQGISLEVKGRKVKGIIEKEVILGVLVMQGEDDKMMKKGNYFRIFPLPLYWKHKETTNICDLSTVMELQQNVDV